MNVDVLYQVNINGDVYETDKAAISGNELLLMAGKQPPGEFVIYLLLEDGDMESIRPTEMVDLQRTGIEKFRTFRADVLYRLEVNGKPREWGSDFITGRAIKRLIDGDEPEEVGIWQKTKSGEDKLIEDTDVVNLGCEGIEKFRVGAKYSICIEGKVFEWSKKTITTEEIIQLGGWDASQGAVEVDKDQNERPLASGEIIKLKPGHNFCKKQRFKRGFDENSRIGKELLLLQKSFTHVDYKEVKNLHWFKIENYPLPSPLSPEVISVVFSVTAGHPVPKPYGFYIPSGVKFGDRVFKLNNPQHPPPFEGSWRFASWDVENWRPGADVTTGDNLWGWARSFRNRLLEGE
ncbi:multiubiquitin domain-containing protein [Teredinibacter turnerae]|uniref:multiubiquitin domain-containing protein n=1 Tax=Teredinibacter turnerae TaxID=2426 RepID=UPI00035C1D63|nr:multiubiquitin domain-containing protein [Teredinibacter turnerae]